MDARLASHAAAADAAADASEHSFGERS